MYRNRFMVKITCTIVLLFTLCLLAACSKSQQIDNALATGSIESGMGEDIGSNNSSATSVVTVSSSVEQSSKNKDKIIRPAIVDISDYIIKAEDIILLDKDLWYVNSQGINKYNLETKKNTVLKETGDYNKIYYSKGNMWFFYNELFSDSEAELKVPLLRYDIENNKFIEYTAEQLQNSSNSVVYGDDTRVWIGGGPKVASLNLSDNTLTFLDNLDMSVNCIAANSKHTWFGTLDAGIKEISYDGKVSTYDSSNGLLDDFVTGLLLNKEKLWVNWGGEGESAGLSYMDLTTGKWKHYISVAGSNFDESKVDKDLKSFTGYAWLDDSGVLWATIQTDTSEELRKFSDKDNKWQHISLDGKLINTAISNGKYDLIASPDGLGVFNTDTNKSEWVIKDTGIKKIFRKGKSSFILVSSSGIKEINFYN